MFNPLPYDVEVNGKRYPVRTGYRAWIEFESVLEKQTDFTQKIPGLIRAVMPVGELPADIGELLGKLFEFYTCGQKRTKKTTGERLKKIYSFSNDFDYIYTAFLTQYNIDLCSTDFHWYRFITLFMGLSNEHKISEIMGYRGMKIGDIKDKKQRVHYRKMKALYALPDNRTLEEIDRDMSEELSKLI